MGPARQAGRFRTLRRIVGTLSPPIHRLLAQDLAALVTGLLDAAVARWAADGWTRFNDHETNCTIQVFRWAQETLRLQPEFSVFTVTLESVSPTRRMLLGQDSAASMRRPDLRISLGLEAKLMVECKRLSLDSSHPAEYVHEGMYRFVTGAYAPMDTLGAMMGYIIADEPTAIANAINTQIDAHDGMGTSHRLEVGTVLSAIPFHYKSSHVRMARSQIELAHLWIDLRPN
ncbi:MAG: hypothetical protein QOG54_114 [Actinomycetota bacterium]|nr:hypothetical protein [Actinomycetota bacterium]